MSPFDRPLTHKSFFNIVYFSLISLRKHQLKEEEERRTDVTQRCTRMEAERKVSLARADVERERLVQLQAELLEARELLARSETTSQSNAATVKKNFYLTLLFVF